MMRALPLIGIAASLSLLGVPVRVGAVVEKRDHVVFANEQVLAKGKLTGKGRGFLARAIEGAPSEAAFTAVVCLGHPAAPRGEGIAELAGELAKVIVAKHEKARVTQVARPANETTCPAGVSIEWRESSTTSWAGAVVLSQGEVAITRADGAQVPGVRGATLAYGDVVAVGAGGQCRLQTAAGAVLALWPQARVALVPGAQSESKASLMSGELWVRISPDTAKGAAVLVEYGGTRASARDATFTLRAVDASTVLVATLKGSVQLHAGGIATTVSQGRAAFCDGATVTGPIEQPEPPRVIRPVSGTFAVGSEMLWHRSDSAKSYVVEIASDVQFMRTAYRSEASTPGFVLPHLSAGIYYWRVFAVAGGGVVGRPSQLFAFEATGRTHGSVRAPSGEPRTAP